MTTFKICENHECRYYVDTKESCGDLKKASLFKDGEFTYISRIMYNDGNGKDYFLCVGCHSAVQLVKKEEKELPIHLESKMVGRQVERLMKRGASLLQALEIVAKDAHERAKRLNE